MILHEGSTDKQLDWISYKNSDYIYKSVNLVLDML